MNQARTTYQADFSPFDWIQNNFTTDTNEFCSPDNIDDCLKYISQEFSALGYPSIYSKSNVSPFEVNCDIVKLLNATFELLRSFSDHTESKEDLESRNRRLSADLNVLSKKNSQLRNTLEQQERKLTSALEKERQLKEKNEQLSQSLKSEREETKRLAAQIKQQKIAYQHEIRKYENNMNHIKAKLNQLLSDKNPNKKIASMSISHNLPRNSGQRGKWNTTTAATSAIEDMYNSIISSYESRIKDMFKEMNSYRQFLQSIFLQTHEVISLLQGNADETDGRIMHEEFVLSTMQVTNRDISSFNENFKILFSSLKDIAKEKDHNRNQKLEEEVNSLKSKLSEYEDFFLKLKVSQTSESQSMTCIEVSKEEMTKLNHEQFISEEKKKLEKEKLTLSKSMENIQKEKAEISAQKLAILKLAIQQKSPASMWHQGLNTSPSISVITCQDGSVRIPNMNMLKFSTSSPDCVMQSPPSWTLNEPAFNKVCFSRSDSLLPEDRTADQASPSFIPLQTVARKLSNSDLPSWALKNSNSQNVIECPSVEGTQNIPEGDSAEMPNESSSEEVNLLRLQAAALDIEARRNNIS